MPESQISLFYEDIMDAINKMVSGNPKGLSLKQIAMELWPSRNPDTARSEFSRCLNSEDHGHNLEPLEIVQTMDITGRPEDIIFCLCDRFGFERPLKKDLSSFEKEVKSEIKSLVDQAKAITRKVEQIGRIKK